MSQQIEPRMRPRPPPPPPPANPPPPLRGTSRGFDLAGSSNSVAAEPMAPALPTASAVSGGGGRPKALMPRSPLVYAGKEPCGLLASNVDRITPSEYLECLKNLYKSPSFVSVKRVSGFISVSCEAEENISQMENSTLPMQIKRT